jgi:ribulose-5-phosphate 4-epimerase/fuculose-1-phosphate aldolase
MAIYAVRRQAQAIVHLHSTYAVAVSCLDSEDDEELIPPLTPYFVMRLGTLARIPYYPPGDTSLGDAVREAAQDHSAFLLANHGPVVSDSSLRAAVYGSEELEETAKLFFLVRGMNARHLNAEQVSELHRRFPRK